MDITLLGPQRITTSARTAVREVIPDGEIATINAGWQERESDDAELGDVLGGRMRNLELFRRWRDVHEKDAEYSLAERRLDTLLDELQAYYALRLQHAMAAVDAVRRRREMPRVQEEALADSVRAVQALDQWHLEAVNDTRAHFRAAFRPRERLAVIDHTKQIDAIIDGCAGFVVTGGHVGVLLRVLRVFDIASRLRAPTVAWSAGAMALAERVVLFHDRAARGATHAEMWADGLGAYEGVLPFPHARRRLRLSDDTHVGLMAQRFAPRTCVLLPDGERVDVGAGGGLPTGARVLDPAGGVTTVGAA